MTISYPVSLPSNYKESQVRLFQINTVGITQSNFTLQSQVYQNAGEAWGLEFSLDPMSRADAAPWMAFLASLRGRWGTFLFGPELLKTPQGTGAGTPVVNGAGQVGTSLVTSGWTPSSAIFKAGDLFQIDQRMYMVLQDVSANGSGNATLDVWPRLRSHSNGASLILSSPKCIFRLSENVQNTIDAPRTGLFQIEFTAEEAL